jgi:hypothetical protein
VKMKAIPLAGIVWLLVGLATLIIVVNPCVLADSGTGDRRDVLSREKLSVCLDIQRVFFQSHRSVAAQRESQS